MQSKRKKKKYKTKDSKILKGNREMETISLNEEKITILEKEDNKKSQKKSKNKKTKYKMLGIILVVIFLWFITDKFHLQYKDKPHAHYKGKFPEHNNNKSYQKICKLIGGLGNQMFIYSFGYSFIKQKNESLAYDITFYKNPGKTTHNVLLINKFNINSSNFIYKKNYLSSDFKKKSEHPNNREYDPSFFTLVGKWYYVSYFHDPKYFEKYRNDLLKIFTLKEPLDPKNTKILNEILSYKNSVSIHIRYGDYADFGLLLDEEYYIKAIEYFRNMEDVHYFVFSNDLELVSKNFNFGKEFTLVNINDEFNAHKELWLMKNCKHNIIANSTFSWWGAWLNENIHKIVISPDKFFIGFKNYANNIIPNDWIKLKAKFKK